MTATADRHETDAPATGHASGRAVGADAPTTDGADLVAQLGELLTCTSWRLRRAARGELEPLG